MSEELANKLKAARTKLNFSQSQAAAAWGIPIRTLRAWEQNQRTPQGFALKALEEKLDAILAEK